MFNITMDKVLSCEVIDGLQSLSEHFLDGLLQVRRLRSD